MALTKKQVDGVTNLFAATFVNCSNAMERRF